MLYKKKSSTIYLCLLLLLLASCAFNNDMYGEKKPEWIFHYHIEGKICAVGSSLPHVDGFPYQQATAISRAIDQIAMQKRVHVNTSLEHFLYGTKDYTHSELSSFSVQTTEGKVVKATVRDTWQDPKTKMLYVWMICDQ